MNEMKYFPQQVVHHLLCVSGIRRTVLSKGAQYLSHTLSFHIAKTRIAKKCTQPYYFCVSMGFILLTST